MLEFGDEQNAQGSLGRALLICAVGPCQDPPGGKLVVIWVCARAPMLISVRDPGLATGPPT